jgi:hypothetical protein
MHTRLTRACFNTTCLSNMLDAVPFILAFLNQDGSFKHITSIPGNRTQTESPAAESSFPKHSWQGLCSMGRTVNSIEIQPFLLVQSQMSCLEHWHLMVVLKSYFISLTCSDNHQWILENPKWIPYRSHINPMNYWMITPWHTTLFCHKKKYVSPTSLPSTVQVLLTAHLGGSFQGTWEHPMHQYSADEWWINI